MSVPDMIRDVVTKAGVTLEKSYPLGSTVSATAQMKEAYRRGDYATIQAQRDQQANDLSPIYENIQNRADKAFFSIINPSDKVQYYMSIAGPAHKPNSYMWIYLPPAAQGLGKSSDGGAAPQPVAQFGHYSVNARALGITMSTWTDLGAQLTSVALTTIITKVLSKYIQNIIIGKPASAALSEAAAAAGEEVVGAEIVTSSAWTSSVSAAASRAVLGLVIGAAAFFLVMFILDWVLKKFNIAVNIYNWDINHNYVVANEYKDNAEIDHGEAFKVTNLPAPSNTVTLPDGMPYPTLDTIYQYVGLVYKNKNQFFEGLGMAFQIKSEDGSTGFCVKYLCSRMHKNKLGISGGVKQSIKDYYNDGSTWAEMGSYTAATAIPGINVPIHCTTDKLNYAENELYQFDVHIGLQPTGQSKMPRNEAPKRVVLKPIKAIVPKEEEAVVLPNGHEVKVVASNI